MNSNSNQLSFSTLTQSYDGTVIPNGTAGNTYTLITTGATNASVITDVLIRSAEISLGRNFNVIICPTGSQASPEFSRVLVAVPANAGSNGSTSIFSLATIVPTLFDVDLAGNRVITLEPGISIYLQNTVALTANFTVTTKRRNF
jgi:hypothetical protein